jgi:hypothetical protein
MQNENVEERGENVEKRGDSVENRGDSVDEKTRNPIAYAVLVIVSTESTGFFLLCAPHGVVSCRAGQRPRLARLASGIFGGNDVGTGGATPRQARKAGAMGEACISLPDTQIPARSVYKPARTYVLRRVRETLPIRATCMGDIPRRSVLLRAGDGVRFTTPAAIKSAVWGLRTAPGARCVPG